MTTRTATKIFGLVVDQKSAAINATAQTATGRLRKV